MQLMQGIPPTRRNRIEGPFWPLIHFAAKWTRHLPIHSAVAAMKIKKPFQLTTVYWFLLPLLLSASPASGVTAMPYQPDRQVTIETEYAAASPSPSMPPRTWRIRATPGKGEVILAAYPAGTDIPFCTITLPDAGAPGRIVLSEPRGRQERSSDNGLFVLPGHPAPVNILPVEQAEAEKFYDEKRTAGGRVFVKRYRVFQEAVSEETALQKGWIPKDAGTGIAGQSRPETRPLRVVTVEDDSRTPVVRQVWREGDSWWIYEETPFKRSRRVE